MADDDRTDNVSIADSENTKIVDIITDAFAKERLAVDAFLTGGNFQLQPFVPEFHYTVTPVALNTSTDVTLQSETSIGKIDFLCVAGSNANFEVALEVDGIEVLRIPMDDLGTLGLSNATNVPIWAETANKN
ncbi:unnamed protein product, partial [marine sediment metagenome]